MLIAGMQCGRLMFVDRNFLFDFIFIFSQFYQNYLQNEVVGAIYTIMRPLSQRIQITYATFGMS